MKRVDLRRSSSYDLMPFSLPQGLVCLDIHGHTLVETPRLKLNIDVKASIKPTFMPWWPGTKNSIAVGVSNRPTVVEVSTTRTKRSVRWALLRLTSRSLVLRICSGDVKMP